MMMKDEIKEILGALRDSIDDTGTDKVNFINWVDKIENYITTLQEENKELKLLSMTQNNREYRSKFLKEYQKEHGKLCYPDYDEIYERYDKLKEEKEKIKKYCKKGLKNGLQDAATVNEVLEDILYLLDKGNNNDSK